MAAYVIFHVEVTDDEQFERYGAAAPPTIAAAGGRLMARGGPITTLEGEAPAGRTVILEFPDHQTALDWYHSDEYTAARALREHAATGSMYLVDGVG